MNATHKIFSVLVMISCISWGIQILLPSVSLAGDESFERLIAEMEGLDQNSEPSPVFKDKQTSENRTLSALPRTGLLLIPDSTNDRIMAFDPATGNLIDADFIPADPTNLSTPIHAILSADGNSILVSDQLEDVVQQYDLSGNYVGVFAPAGGVDTSILDNIRGIALQPNGNLLVTVGSGTNAEAVAEFDPSGNYLGNFIANTSGGLDSPFDVLFRATQSDYLVGGITSDKIHRYDLNGSSLGDFADIDSFPEQLALAGNGNVLVGNFSGTQEGVLEFDSGGSLINVYDPPSLDGYRGVYELPNGNILTTNGSGVHEIVRSGNLIDTKISGVSARFIQFVQPESRQQIPTLSQWGTLFFCLIMIASALWIIRRSRHA